MCSNLVLYLRKWPLIVRFLTAGIFSSFTLKSFLQKPVKCFIYDCHLKGFKINRLQETFMVVVVLHSSAPPLASLSILSPSILLFICPSRPDWTRYLCYLRQPLWGGRGLLTSHRLLCQLVKKGGEGKKRRRTGKAAPQRHWRRGGSSYTRPSEALFSDSLFCNCPINTASSPVKLRNEAGGWDAHKLWHTCPARECVGC